MAVLVEVGLGEASDDQVAAAQMLGLERGQRLNQPPYPGCVFVAVVRIDSGFRLTSAWRTAEVFRATYEAALRPDLLAADIQPSDPVVLPVVAMAIPGAHAA